MQEQVEALRQQLRHKQAGIQLLDNQLRQQLNTQQLLQHILQQQGSSSIASSQVSSQSDYSGRSQSSLSSIWLMDQIQRVNQLVSTCIQPIQTQNLTPSQIPSQTRPQFKEQPHKYTSQSSPVQQIKPKATVQAAQKQFFPFQSNPGLQPAVSKEQPSLRQQQLKLQRHAIRQAIISQQHFRNCKPQSTPYHPSIKYYQQPPNQPNQQQPASQPTLLNNRMYSSLQPQFNQLGSLTSKYEGLQSLKRKRAIERSAREIRKAKAKSDEIQVLIKRGIRDVFRF